MFNKVRQDLHTIRVKVLNGLSNVSSDVGPLSFFTQWFNPNNLVGELEQLEKYTGIVYACISAIAEDVARIQFTINRKQADGTLDPMQSNQFVDLLDNPNPTQSAYPFWEMIQTHIELTGEAFIYVPKGSITAKPKELWIMRPDLVQVVYDMETGEVTGYVYHKWNGRVQIPLDLDEVIHFKMPNPINPYRGLGTVQAGIVYIQTEEYASRFSRNYLANNATPAGIVNFKGTIADPEFQKVKRQWTREYGSVENAGKTAFVRNADVSYQKIGSTLQDIDLKELKNLTRDDIMFMFRVSKPILGITEDVNYSNAKTAEYVFAKRVIDPKMNRIIDTLQTFYNSKYKDGLLLGYASPIPQDNDEKIAYYTAAVNTWLTPNEVRAAEGFDDLPGGDEIRMPFNLQPIDVKPTTPISGTTEEPPTKAMIRIKRTVTKDVEPAPEVQPSGLEKTKEDFRVLLFNTAHAYAPQVRHEVEQAVAKQRGKILAQLKTLKAKDIKKKALDDIDYSTDETADNISEAIKPVLIELMTEAGKYAMQLAGSDLQYELSQKSLERLAQRIAKVAGDYSAQTQQDLVSLFEVAVQEGWAVTKITAGVEDVFSAASGYRAERIARTETGHESNAATLDAYQQTGYVVSKEWYAGGPDPCQFCEGLNGTVVKTDEVFVSKGETVEGVDGGKYLADYEDVEAGDLHPNCECTIIPVGAEI